MRNGQVATVSAICALALGAMASRLARSDEPKKLGPAAWGGDHVGKPVPEYPTGDECLFCHREVGKTWGENRHNLTVRPAAETGALKALQKSDAKEFADAVKFVLGGQHRQRFLKPSKEYGKLDLLSVEWVPPRDKQPAKFASAERPHWNMTQFADSCAGCHATAVDPKEKAFSAVALDCFACHGDVP